MCLYRHFRAYLSKNHNIPALLAFYHNFVFPFVNLLQLTCTRNETKMCIFTILFSVKVCLVWNPSFYVNEAVFYGEIGHWKFCLYAKLQATSIGALDCFLHLCLLGTFSWKFISGLSYPVYVVLFHKGHNCEYCFKCRCVIKEFDHVGALDKLLNASVAVQM